MKNDYKISISIVEDDPTIGQGLQEKITKLTNYVCNHLYMNAEDAEKGITKNKPDIVIMDIGLPGKNGVECMKTIQESGVFPKFIMFTIFDTDELLFEALKNGASGYILKDSSFSTIMGAIKEVILGGGPMSPSIARKVISSFNKQNKNPSLEQLTQHQSEILGYIADGLLNKEIADILHIKEGSLKNQITTIYKKLQVNNRVEAASLYKRDT